MEDLKILKEMLVDNALIQSYKDSYGKECVRLCEQSSDGISYQIEIRCIPTNALIIKVDKFPAPSSIFNGDLGECKRADYAIINVENKEIICIELKKTSDSWKSIVQQLQGAKCTVKYLQEIGMEFWGKSYFLENYTHWYVVVGHIGQTSKRPSRKRSGISVRHNSPQNALKIDYPARNIIFYKQLLSAP